MSDTSKQKRAEARARGLRLAARVATVGGIAVAAMGLVEARAAASAPTRPISSVSASDDDKPLPMEGWMKARGGNCGCAPCWGPPAPPAKSGLS